MRFYDRHHRFYCGIDPHARSMDLCLRVQTGTIVLHQNLVAQADNFLEAIELYRDDLVVGCACMLAWNWRSLAEPIPNWDSGPIRKTGPAPAE